MSMISAAQKISLCLWFDTEGEAAATFYTSLLPGSRITDVSRYGKGMPMPEGTAMVVKFDLAGASFMALNGGPIFQPSEAASIVVHCDDQAEVDRLWDALTSNGGHRGGAG
jgi:predicted 3-demethylubiquinone-9 3-methyltransferase (glyoxalase superfamily)